MEMKISEENIYKIRELLGNQALGEIKDIEEIEQKVNDIIKGYLASVLSFFK